MSDSLREDIQRIVAEHRARLNAMGGCGDSSCRFVRPAGMCTNGGCRCHLGSKGNIIAHMLMSLRIELEHALKLDGERP